MIIVSKQKEGAFTSLQEAILSVEDTHSDEITIFVEAGLYEEKIFIRKNKIRIVGEDREQTIIRYGDGARKPREDGTEYGTFNTATVLFAGCDITVENITIENSAGDGHIAGQALAVYIASDRTSFYHCKFLGNQDTIYTGDLKPSSFKKLMLPDFFKRSSIKTDFPVSRNYFKDCFICGNVDFIFGSNIAYFDHCEIFSKKSANGEGSYITAASTPINQEFGYIFNNCSLTGDFPKNSTYLGRPWRNYAKTAFLCCTMDNHIKPEGWHNWGKVSAEVNTSYVEYGNTGEGSEVSKRASFSKPLTNKDILEYLSKENVLSGEDGWNP